jgi:hypothetical protein
VFLTLVPAIRRGPAYVAKNGSPWGWPLYPGILFSLLACGALVRSYWVCVSFHFVLRSQTIFGPYLLVPLLLCLCVLGLELGLATGRVLFLRFALFVPLGLLVLSLCGHRDDAVYSEFLHRFTQALGGTPAYFTLLALIGFYAFAMYRRIAAAGDGLALCLFGLAWVGPATLGPADFTATQPWALVASSIMLLVRAAGPGDPVRSGTAGLLLISASWIALPDRSSLLERLVVADHVAMAVCLVIAGVVGRSSIRAFCQQFFLGLLASTSIALSVSGMIGLGLFPDTVTWAYPFAAGMVALGYGAWSGHSLARSIGRGLLGLGLVGFAWDGYRWLRGSVAGLDRIALGFGFFALAVAISARKASMIASRSLARTAATQGGISVPHEVPS